jgi:hypothetical protein
MQEKEGQLRKLAGMRAMLHQLTSEDGGEDLAALAASGRLGTTGMG